MSQFVDDLVLRTMAADAIVQCESIQSLWSGYGEIVKFTLAGAPINSVVVKHIVFPDQAEHPWGWNTDLSNQRKLSSYEVEMAWYKNFSQRCGEQYYVPKCYATEASDDEHVIVLEDLDAAGFPRRKSHLNLPEVRVCLRWLAHFHARFMGVAPTGLWPVGTYWHLATRPDEWQAMADSPLKQAAPHINQKLNNAYYQCLVHGDAKVANFCFSEDGQRVAVVDFQYVGAGCGMKDVVYLLGSCLSEDECERWNEGLVDDYFSMLKQALVEQGKQLDWAALEAEWRGLFAVAWVDFYRFLLGWMPDHDKVNGYCERLTASVLAGVDDD